MKKIVFAAAIAIVAVCSQANTMNWGLNTSGTLDTTVFASGTAYFLLTDATTGVPSSYATALAGKESFSAADIAASSTQLATATVSGGAFTGSEVITSLSGKNYFYMAVISDDGKAMAITTTTKTTNMSTATLATNMRWTSTQFTTYTASSTPSGVPEPTSGLLLVLGGAMLALRRRRA